jgi:hypothetical protein
MDIPRKDATDQELVYRPYGDGDFEKVAQEIELGQDVREWPATILQEFASEHPYAFQVSAPEIEFERIDEKSGTAFGAIILRKPYQTNGLGGPGERLEAEPEKVAVPVIIEAFHLKPFHVFIRGEKVMPLTETRFAEASAGSSIANGLDPMFQPSPTFSDKMMPPTVGYLGNLYGNSMNSGDGGYGVQDPSKGASEKFEPKLDKTGGSADPSKERTFISQLRGTIRNSDYEIFQKSMGDERAISGFAMNKTLNIVREILGTKPTSFDDYTDFVEGAAPVHLVCMCRRTNGMWAVTETNDYFFKPVVKEMKPKDVVAKYSKIRPEIARLMQGSDEILIESDVRTHVKPIILEDHEVVSELVGADGHYLLVTNTGGFVEGQVFVNVLDYSGNATGLRLAVTGNAYSLQEAMVGEKMGDVLPALTPGSVEVGVEGTFAGSQDGVQSAILPFKVTNVGFVSSYMVAQAVGMAGEHLSFVFMPGVTRFFNATGIADPVLGSLVGGNVYYVPPSFHFLSLGKKLRLVDDPRHAKSLLGRKVFTPERGMEPFSVETSKRGLSRALRIISSGQGSITLKGGILSTIGRDEELQDLSGHEAHWILSLLGVSLDEAAKLTAMAIGRGEINISNLRPAKDVIKKDVIQDRALSELASVFRRNLVKAASTISDPRAADAMLSLNFVNESNLTQFMENLPAFRETEEKLAELYLYVCLGLKSQVPEQAVLMAMNSLNEVNEHLEYLSSMMRMPSSQSQPAPAA